VLCNLQAALTVATMALDAQLQGDPTIGKLLVKVRPGSAPCPALGIYEQVRHAVCQIESAHTYAKLR